MIKGICFKCGELIQFNHPCHYEEERMEGQIVVDKTHKDYGTKYDEGKPMIGLIAAEAIWKEAEVMTFGGKKYGLFNWAKGISVLRLLSAAMRHILQFLMGQDNDDETSISHLAHARCCLAMAMWMVEHKPEFDDRFKEIK